jgi:hypothetical protein
MFAEVIAFTPVRDLFLHLQTYLVRNLGFRVRVLDLSLYLPSMGLDHNSRQVMNFVYTPSHCRVALLNKTLKLEMQLLKQLVFIILTYTGVTSVKIRLMSFSRNQNIQTLVWKHDL